jgi:hypothetical protein
VVEEMRKEDDRGVEQRRDMVDLKEREAARAEQKAAVEREAIRQEERRVAQERTQTNQERDNIAREREQARQDQAAGRDTQAKEQELARREQETDQKSEDLDRREEQLDDRREDARRTEEFAEQKTTEAQQERESIAQDQQAVISDEERQARGVIGANIEVADTGLGRLVRIDPQNGEELKRSPLETVSVRTLSFFNGKIIAIAGENRGNGAIRLIEVNNSNLEMAKQGDDDIHPNSLLWVNGSDLYAITVDLKSGVLNLGRFDANLTLQAKSAINVHPNASVTIQKDSLLTQDSSGKAVILNPADLKRKY